MFDNELKNFVKFAPIESIIRNSYSVVKSPVTLLLPQPRKQATSNR